MSGPAKEAPAGRPAAAGLEVAIVAARFNGAIVDRLVEGALAELEALGLARDRVRIHRAPGAFELALVTQAVIRGERPDAVIALGAVIRGETPHFDFVAAAAAQGLQRVSLDERVPVAFGVITANDAGQAEARTRPPLDRGREAARAAVESVRALERIGDRAETLQ